MIMSQIFTDFMAIVLQIRVFWTCQQDISKTIWARDLKLGQLMVDDEQITWLTFEQMLPSFSGVVDFCKGHFNLVSKAELAALNGDDE